MNREELGKLVRETWVNYCRETGDTKPSHVAPWEELSEWDKEADRRIGEAVASAVNERLLKKIERRDKCIVFLTAFIDDAMGYVKELDDET